MGTWDGMGWGWLVGEGGRDGMGMDGMERDGTGWGGKGWDGKGWDGMKQDGVGWDGVGWDSWHGMARPAWDGMSREAHSDPLILTYSRSILQIDPRFARGRYGGPPSALGRSLGHAWRIAGEE